MQEREYWRGTEISSLLPNEIFVFGSNPGGYHGLGAAKSALNFGAVMKKGRGLYGQSYALVTKNLLPNFKEYSTGITYVEKGPRSVSKEQIIENIRELYKTARQSPHLKFLVSYQYNLDKYGKPKASLNGYYPDEMIEMFTAVKVPDNVIFHDSYKNKIQVLLDQQANKEKSNAQNNAFVVPEQFKESRLQEARAQRGLPPYTREELNALMQNKPANEQNSSTSPVEQPQQPVVRRFSSKGSGVMTPQTFKAPVVSSPQAVNYNVSTVIESPQKKGGSFKPTMAIGSRPVEEETGADVVLNNDEFSSFDDFNDVFGDDAEVVKPAPAPAPAPVQDNPVNSVKKGGSFKPSFRLGSRPAEDAPVDAEDIPDIQHVENVVAVKETNTVVTENSLPVANTNTEFNGWDDLTFETSVEENIKKPNEVVKDVKETQTETVIKKGGFRPSFRLGSRPDNEVAIQEDIASTEDTVSTEALYEEYNRERLHEDESFNSSNPNNSSDKNFDSIFLGVGNQTQIEIEDTLNVRDLIPTDFLSNNVDQDVAFFVVNDGESKPLLKDEIVVKNMDGTTMSETRKKLDAEKAKKAEEILNKYSAAPKERQQTHQVEPEVNIPAVVEEEKPATDRPKFRLGSKILVNPETVVPEKVAKAPKLPKASKPPKAPKANKSKTGLDKMPTALSTSEVEQTVVAKALNVEDKTTTSVSSDSVEKNVVSATSNVEEKNSHIVDEAQGSVIPPTQELSDFGKQAGFDDFNNIQFEDYDDLKAPDNSHVSDEIQNVAAPIEAPVVKVSEEKSNVVSPVVNGDVYDPFGDAYEYPEFLQPQVNMLDKVDMIERTPFVRVSEMTSIEKDGFEKNGDDGVGVREPSPVVEEKTLPVEVVDDYDDDYYPMPPIEPKPIVEKITVGVSRERFVRVKDMTQEQLNALNLNAENVVDKEITQTSLPKTVVEPVSPTNSTIQQLDTVVEVKDANVVDSLNDLPNENEYTMFFSLNSPFSNFYPAKFHYDGLTFASNEQFMMFAKANLFNDQKSMDKIIEINNTSIVKDFLEGKYTSEDILKSNELLTKWNDVQKNIKSIGRGVSGYVDAIWDKERESWVEEGASQKFIQNEDLKQKLLSTDGTKMIEASPYDKIWGIGLDKKTALKTPISKWPGKNLLGNLLDRVRDNLKNNLIVAHTAPAVKNLPNKDDYLAFETVKTPLNNLFPAKFFFEGLTFSSNEQFMMLSKAQIFSDYETFDKVMAVNELPLVKSFLSGEVSDKDIVSNPNLLNEWTSIQKDLIALGRGVKNYDDNIWVAERENWVKDGLDQKFAQNEHLAKWLISTGDKKIVKLGTENVWGLAMSLNDFFNTSIDDWNGKNLLGKLIESTRKDIRENNIIVYKDPFTNNEVQSNVNNEASLNAPKENPKETPKEKAKDQSKSELYDTNDYHFFYSLYSPFSNFHPAKFKFKDLEFSSSEQFYMYSKAKFFKNDELANKIMKINENPLVKQFLNDEVSSNRILRYHSEEWFNLTLEIKKIGHTFPKDNAEWDMRRESVMGVALREKFGQSDELKQLLLKTDNKIMVEASPKDKFWGAGLSKDDILNVTPDKWPGENVLGQWLGHLREKFTLEAQTDNNIEDKKRKGKHP